MCPTLHAEIGPEQPDRRERRELIDTQNPSRETRPVHVRRVGVHSEKAVGRLQVQAVQRTFPWA